DLSGISEYFKTPLKVAMQGGSGSGDSSSVIQGGGTDLSRKDGQVKKGETLPERKTYDLRAAKMQLERAERLRLDQLKTRIEQTIEANPQLRKFKNQLLLDITSEGLRIQIVDEKKRPMFALASARLQDYTRDILIAIGSVLNDVPNKISISGHTDLTPYPTNAGYTNWELSSDRANASRRELVAAGMDENKLMRVVGLASAVNLDDKDPFNPINRRISIIVMNKKTEEAVARESGRLDVTANAAQELEGALVPAAAPPRAPAPAAQ
ncbi:MAG TPA: flagellar motor protein MotB, partial [Telluria sp.]|nr:flagellar motor protein MotB [Telluria sp.]